MCLCERQNVGFCCLPLEGLFWTAVHGVQVVHLMAKAHTLYSQRPESRWWCVLHDVSSPVLLLPFCVSYQSPKTGKKISTHLKTCPINDFWNWKMVILVLTFLVWTPPFPLSLCYFHSCTHARTHAHTRATLVHDWLLCLHARAWSRRILNIFFYRLWICHCITSPVLNTQDLALLVFLARAQQ